MRPSHSRLTRLAPCLALFALLALTMASGASAAPYATGDVFAGVGTGKIKVFSPTGVLKQTLDTTSSSNEDTGMCFDGSGNLYSTNFSAGNMTKFNNSGTIIQHPWGGPFNNPESCSVDQSNNVFVGDASTDLLRKFNSSGTLLDDDAVSTPSRGTDWIDLAADQCTVYYTSEGSQVLRYNMCTDTQLANFADGLAAPCFALRIRPNGEVLVACQPQVYRLSPTGTVLQTYPAAGFSPAGSYLFALNVDPDGQTFWTGDIFTGQIWRINIATGAQVTSFNAAPFTTMAGLAVFGEQTVGGPPTGGTMVGKGRLVDSTNGNVDYALKVRCSPTTPGSAFTAKWGSSTFQLSAVRTVDCKDDPAIAYDPPNADFDTQEGTGVGTVNGAPGWTIEWKSTDEGNGAGDVNDSQKIVIKNPAGATVINVFGKPPGPFPGSRQPTGQNTATTP
jgi:hypothetical protein